MTTTPSRMSALSSSGRLHLLFLLALAVATTFHVQLTLPSHDAFHEGEYAVLGFLARTIPDFRMPILTHGGMDFIPSWLAAATCSTDHQIVCVRLVNTTIQFGSVLLFLAIVVAITGLGTPAACLASIPALAMIWTSNGAAYSIVAAHHGAPGIRDVMLLGGLAIIAWFGRDLDRMARASAVPVLFGLGCLTALGTFWTYNRGMVLVAVVGLFGLAILVLRRSALPVIWLVLGGVAGLGAVVALGGISHLVDTIANILYWHRNADIWTAPMHAQNIPTLGLLTLFVLGGGAVTGRSLARSGRQGDCLLLVILCFTFILYVGQSLTRPDLWHLRWVMVPATLVLAVVIREWAGPMLTASWPNLSWPLVAFVVLSTACVETYSERSILRIVMSGLVDNIRALRAPMPTDRALVGEDISRVADLIRGHDRCAFVANNAGIVHLMAQTPPCSRFMFSIYIAPQDQDVVIADLAARRPSLILWDGPSFYSRFDRRGIRDRQPILSAWIETNYPVRTMIGQQVILSREPLSREPLPR